jgi:D-tagatose-1,6-bisphosphate aldolase subunit GatZ/KbaZ
MIHHALSDLVADHRCSRPSGLYSVCSAHPSVLEASMKQALDDGSPLLVESTCNQVNQEGGYTGMLPAEFERHLCAIARRFHFPRERLILGGDHLGPIPWQQETAARAMAKARALVRDCVLAGYAKIHLDASVRCADDSPDVPLVNALKAERAAELCQVAEEAYMQSGSNRATPCYVIGTEVPPPGGAQQGDHAPAITAVEHTEETIELTRKAFAGRGLDAAWERVVAIVVQPGVEFGDHTVYQYDRHAAAQLTHFIEAGDPLVFEAHSTDYQTRQALRALVEDHFAILKVGPALTFAFREAVFALALIETEWLSTKSGVELSGIRQALDQAMQRDPTHWRKYHAGSECELQFARRYSFSDRSRYYWPDPGVQQSLTRLFNNLERYPAPLTLLSQYLPVQYERAREGALQNTPRDLVNHKIRTVLADYAYACGYTR